MSPLSTADNMYIKRNGTKRNETKQKIRTEPDRTHTGNGYIEGRELDHFLREFVASVSTNDLGADVSNRSSVWIPISLVCAHFYLTSLLEGKLASEPPLSQFASRKNTRETAWIGAFFKLPPCSRIKKGQISQAHYFFRPLVRLNS